MISTKSFILDERNLSEPKQYVLTIHDLPSEEKPREKLLEFGPGALTIDELLAVILITGTKKKEF